MKEFNRSHRGDEESFSRREYSMGSNKRQERADESKGAYSIFLHPDPTCSPPVKKTDKEKSFKPTETNCGGREGVHAESSEDNQQKSVHCSKLDEHNLSNQSYRKWAYVLVYSDLRLEPQCSCETMQYTVFSYSQN